MSRWDGVMRAALVAVVLAGCSPPKAGHIEESSPPLVFTEGSVDEHRERGIQPGECPAEVSDYPVPFFHDRVLLRLPVGVNEDNFVEFTPGVLARSTGPIESANCHDGMPGATIHFMAMTIFAGQPGGPDKSLEGMRDEVLDAFGYPDDIVLVEYEHDPAEPAGMWVYEVSPDESIGKPDPVKILLSMQAAHGHTVAIVYEVHPDAWSVIVDTLVRSARSLSIVSP
jgi:hypothetical protein